MQENAGNAIKCGTAILMEKWQFFSALKSVKNVLPATTIYSALLYKDTPLAHIVFCGFALALFFLPSNFAKERAGTPV